jgi:hypothetical protein
MDRGAVRGEPGTVHADESPGNPAGRPLKRECTAALVARVVRKIDESNQTELDILLSDLLCAAWPTPCAQRQ